ncbi:TetR/AcrR family transcriptional regulator [Rhodobacteraceae bacterium]|nr:TetR/AcrR family transcriptional regulator [Paracoccaceae bacterium]
MPSKRNETADKIRVAARAIVKAEGPDHLTFDAVAAQVGVSKQAVLYWFPNKARLIEALVRPTLEAESNAGKVAIASQTTAGDAIRAYISALAVFHSSDLERFRLMYVTPQIGQRSGRNGTMLTTLGRIHPSTTEMYDSLAEKMVEHGRYDRMIDARRAATAIHTALLGLILRMAMSDTLNSPLRSRDDALVDALVNVMAPKAA